MLDKSYFVTQKVHLRKIKLGDGKEHDIYLKELTNVQWRRHLLVETNGTNEERAGEVALLVSQCLVNADGTQAVSFEDAQNIKTSIVIFMFDAIKKLHQQPFDLEVNEEGKSSGTESVNTPTSGSGTSSA